MIVFDGESASKATPAGLVTVSLPTINWPTLAEKAPTWVRFNAELEDVLTFITNEPAVFERVKVPAPIMLSTAVLPDATVVDSPPKVGLKAPMFNTALPAKPIALCTGTALAAPRFKVPLPIVVEPM